ncbi:hypothetical protein FOL47_006515 [Perkinsus chesapeaki]|uniref:subtilisin n=1 Tax=Perkinsus chesapeaki TaxID=330153 RepID=A0A7J6LRN2_PERCH|nr:hypothetical protein FOL47_006515 [Perkinsus chesapeaki]
MIIMMTAQYVEGDRSPVNDPLYRKQKKYFEAVGVPGAWRRLSSTRVIRNKITVASIDTGVRSNHSDLVANLAPGYNVIKHNSDTEDEVGHGTRMAGIDGAAINNSLLMAGVSDMVGILPVSFQDQYTEQAESDAIDWAMTSDQW